MVAVSTAQAPIASAGFRLPTGRPFTVDDLQEIPDDGNRYELLDGVLVVTPAPGWYHQVMAGALFAVLREACPDDLRVLLAPFAFQPSIDIELQPDVLVARFEQFTAKNLPTPPLLAAEVASPSTSVFDRHTKRAAYERLGVASYWLLDPAEGGAITVLEQDGGGQYREVASVVGEQPLVVERPFPVTLSPAGLLADTRPR